MHSSYSTYIITMRENVQLKMCLIYEMRFLRKFQKIEVTTLRSHLENVI